MRKNKLKKTRRTTREILTFNVLRTGKGNNYTIIIKNRNNCCSFGLGVIMLKKKEDPEVLRKNL